MSIIERQWEDDEVDDSIVGEHVPLNVLEMVVSSASSPEERTASPTLNVEHASDPENNNKNDAYAVSSGDLYGEEEEQDADSKFTFTRKFRDTATSLRNHRGASYVCAAIMAGLSIMVLALVFKHYNNLNGDDNSAAAPNCDSFLSESEQHHKQQQQTPHDQDKKMDVVSPHKKNNPQQQQLHHHLQQKQQQQPQKSFLFSSHRHVQQNQQNNKQKKLSSPKMNLKTSGSSEKKCNPKQPRDIPSYCVADSSKAVQDAIIRWIGVSRAYFFDVCVLSNETQEYQQLVRDAGLQHQQQQQSSSSKPEFEQVAPKGNDAFSIEFSCNFSSSVSSSSDPPCLVKIRGTTGVSAGSGFYYAAKNFFGAQFTWGVNGTGDQTASIGVSFSEMHEKIASVFDRMKSTSATKIVLASTVPIRYSWNMCTFGYSSTFWDWTRWQRELDWFLFHGINFPLALLGQEYIWVKVFESFGLTFEEIQEWFSGPAFLPWQRAGNLKSFGGPLPLSWITQQYQLQVKLLASMRTLGMTPILPCFGGHVPKAVEKVFPNIKLSESPSKWNNFPRVWFVDPVDPAFVQIGERFMQKLQEVYGFDSNEMNYFSCDEYNENNPSNSTSEYLSASSSNVVEYISKVNPKGVWVLQGWLFGFGYWHSYPQRVEAYLNGAPKNRLMILDLHSEDGVLAFDFNSYYGHAFIWCLLHNYGGRRGIYGDLELTATGPFQSLPQQHSGSTMLGMGFTPEAIEQNPIIYELLTENFYNLTADTSPSTELFIKANTRPGIISILEVLPPFQNQFNVSMWLNRYIGQRYFSLANAAQRSSPFASSSSTTASLINAPYLITNFAPKTWQAWKLLLSTLYNQRNDPVSEIEREPMINAFSGDIKYSKDGDGRIVLEAMQLFSQELTEKIMASSNDGERNSNYPLTILGNQNVKSSVSYSGPVFYDLVDISRQASVMYFGSLHQGFLNVAWQNSNAANFLEEQFDATSSQMLDIILAIDDLYSTNPNYLFGHWLQEAIDNAPISPSLNATENQKLQELWFYNAKNQVTLWGPRAYIDDYAQKPWQGLYKNYYALRWKTAFNFIKQAKGGMLMDLYTWKNELINTQVSWCDNFTANDQMSPSSSAYLRSANEISTLDQLNQTISKLNNLIIDGGQEILDSKFVLVKAGTKKVVTTPVKYFPSPWTTSPQQLAKICSLMGKQSCGGFATTSFDYAGFGIMYQAVEVNETSGWVSGNDIWMLK